MVIAVTLVAGGVVAVAMRLAGADLQGSIRYGLALSLIGAGMAALGALSGQSSRLLVVRSAWLLSCSGQGCSLG